MILYTLGNVLLKVKRERLKREVGMVSLQQIAYSTGRTSVAVQPYCWHSPSGSGTT